MKWATTTSSAMLSRKTQRFSRLHAVETKHLAVFAVAWIFGRGSQLIGRGNFHRRIAPRQLMGKCASVINFVTVWLPQYLPLLLRGTLITVELTCLSMALALVIGMFVALGRGSDTPWLRRILGAYLELWRDIPLVVQLFIIYFTLPEIGIRIPAFWAGVLGLSLNLGAYLSEVFRAAIAAIALGQRDAAISLGMSRIAMYKRIILPQAFLIAIPTITGYFISLLKDCSLVSFISVNELLRSGTIIIAETFDSMRVYLAVGIIYFILSFVSSRILRWLELRLTPQYLKLGAARTRFQAAEKTSVQPTELT
jgi:His/Glu/Gln/Arg/opine family amino acid ABC transporter permease subunit